jgi:hypothetical protein
MAVMHNVSVSEVHGTTAVQPWEKMPDFNYILFTLKYFNRITNRIQARRIPVNPRTRCIHAIARQI